MKAYIVIFALLIFFTSCQEDNETIYSVDPALAPYVETFYTEAQERGVTIPRNLVAKLSDTQAISEADTRMGQKYVRFNMTIFPALGPELQEAHVYYRMAQAFLYINISDGESFANPNFMFEPYNPENKEAMFDRLFED